MTVVREWEPLFLENPNLDGTFMPIEVLLV